jgi:putative peptidoglycan lipid II flippase
MVLVLVLIRHGLTGWFKGSVGERLVGTVALVGGGMAVYFPLVWVLGGTDKEELRTLLRRRRPQKDAG